MDGKKYAAAVKSQPKLILLAEATLEEATEHATDLAAVGYDAAKLTAFQSAYTTLKTEKAQQDKKKGDNLELTAVYYTKLNTVWRDYMVKLNRARDMAFPDNYARWILYELYPGSATSRFEHVYDLSPEGMRWVLLEHKIGPDTLVKMSNKGTQQLVFFFSDANGSMQPVVFLEAGETLEKTQAEYGTTGQWLFMHNQWNSASQLEISYLPAEES